MPRRTIPPTPTFWVIATVLLLLVVVLVWMNRRTPTNTATSNITSDTTGDTFASYPTSDPSYATTPPNPTHIQDAPPYDPSKYTADPYVQNSHNCYAYALDFVDPALTRRCKTLLTNGTQKTCFSMRPKPGRASNTHQDLPRQYRMTCPRIMDGVLGDVEGAYQTSREATCAANHYKIAFATDPHRTYHFYRQDADGGWSHKDAWRPVTRKDASGEPIHDPAEADRVYGHANLSDFCGYVCVPGQGYRATTLR